MADSLAISLTLPTDRLARFVARLGPYLEPDTPCSEALLRARAETRSELPLTLRFAPDPALIDFAREHPDIRCSTAGEVALGYLFAFPRCVPGAIEIALCTSSRSIVRVLKESAQVHALLMRLASLGQPPEVRFTDEWNDVTVLRAQPGP